MRNQRRQLSPYHQKLQYVLSANEKNQKKTAAFIGVSTGTVSSAKDDTSYDPKPKIGRAIDTAFTKTSVLWSTELETVSQFIQRSVRAACSLDPTDDERAQADAWGRIVVLVRAAASGWWLRAQDPAAPFIERIFYARQVAFVLVDFVYSLHGMPGGFRKICDLEVDDAIEVGKRASELVIALLADESAKASVLRATTCKTPEIAWRALSAKATNSYLHWAYRSDTPSAAPFIRALDEGFGDDCEFMSKLCPEDPGWYNARWQAAMRAGQWKRTANYAAFLVKPRFRPLLKDGLYDLDALVDDRPALPGLAAVLAHPENPDLAHLVHRLEHDTAPAIRKMTALLKQMIGPIKSRMPYSEVLKAISTNQGA